jgi:hypothetical protein
VGTLDGEPSHASVWLRLLGVRFRAGQVLSQESDLSGVMRLMLTDMEPLAKIVGWTPRPIFVDGHKPGVVALAEFRQRFCTGLPEDVQVVVSIVALDGFPAPRPPDSSPHPTAASRESGQVSHFLFSNVLS